MKRNVQIDADLAILEAVTPPGTDFSQHEISRITGISRTTIENIEHRAIQKIKAKLAEKHGHVAIQASSPLGVIFGNPADLAIQAAASDALPTSIVWMPAGKHNLTAHTLNGPMFNGQVICDEQAARAVTASFNSITGAGQRVWFDFDHQDGAASAWVKGFSWDATKGIMASLEWTPGGEAAVRTKSFFSFSPAFYADANTGRVVGLIKGHAAGGLVNAPAFGAAMPALIAARLGTNINPEGGNSNITKMNKELLLKILAALNVTPDANATDDQLVALVAKHAANGSDVVAKLTTDLAAVTAKLDEATKTAKDEAAKVALQAKATQDREALVEKTLVEVKAVQAALAAGIGRARVEVSDSAEEVIKGYALLAKDPSARGRFYKNSVRPVLAKIGGKTFGRELHRALSILAKNVEIQAANSLGTLVGNLIAQRSFDLLKYEFPILKAITTDFSNESAQFNQSIITRLKSAISPTSYTGAAYAAANATLTDVTLTLSNHYYAQVAFNANELASTNRDLFGEQGEVLMYALGNKIVTDLYALITTGNYTTAALVLGGTGAGTATGDGTGYARQSAIYAAKALWKNKVPGMGRFNLLNADAFGALSSDPSIVSLAAFQKPDIITGYELPPIAGMQSIQAVNLPTTGSLVGFAFHSRAMAVATRVPNDYTQALPGANYGAISTVTDEDTGLSVMQTQYVDHNAGTSNLRNALMYGVAVGDPVAGIITQHS